MMLLKKKLHGDICGYVRKQIWRRIQMWNHIGIAVSNRLGHHPRDCVWDKLNEFA